MLHDLSIILTLERGNYELLSHENYKCMKTLYHKYTSNCQMNERECSDHINNLYKIM